MAGRGYAFEFHGAFARKLAAESKERELKRRGRRAFIRRRRIKGDVRYLVLTERTS